MAQHATPISDTANTDDAQSGLGPWWSDNLGSFTNIYKAVAQSSPPSDSSNITDTVSIPPLNPGTRNIYVAKLSAASDPGVDTDHILRVRGLRAVAGDLLVELRQGYVSEASKGTLIESNTANLDIFQQTFAFNLLATNIANITDYSNLHVRIGNVGDNFAQLPWIDLEVPDPASRAALSWAVLEVPEVPGSTLTVINNSKNFNGPKLLEELAAQSLSPGSLVFAGFDLQANGYLWVPSTAAKSVPPDGTAQPADLRFYYSFTLTSAQLATINSVLAAHDATVLTSDQQLESDNATAMATISANFPRFVHLTKAQQVGVLRVLVSGIAVAAPDGKLYTRLVAFAGS